MQVVFWAKVTLEKLSKKWSNDCINEGGNTAVSFCWLHQCQSSTEENIPKLPKVSQVLSERAKNEARMSSILMCFKEANSRIEIFCKVCNVNTIYICSVLPDGVLNLSPEQSYQAEWYLDIENCFLLHSLYQFNLIKYFRVSSKLQTPISIKSI